MTDCNANKKGPNFSEIFGRQIKAVKFPRFYHNN